MTVIYFPRN